MLDLTNVTLVFVDCIYPERTFRAVKYCTEACTFSKVKFFTNKIITIPKQITAAVEVVKIPEINSLQKYSRFVLTELHKYIDTDFCMISQADGFVLNANSWQKEFLDYDYIGAPWWWYTDGMNVGNGGFSIRSKRLMEFVDGTFFDDVNIYHPEDHYICRTKRKYFEAAGFTFAPREIADKFSIENGRWDGQFGFHDMKTDITNWYGFKAFNVDPNVRQGI